MVDLFERFVQVIKQSPVKEPNDWFLTYILSLFQEQPVYARFPSKSRTKYNSDW